MAIKDLPKYKDIRGTIRRNGRYPYVGTAVKDTHVVHHSLTKTGTPEAFANYHISTHGWQGCAYAFVIQQDGTIYQCDDLDRRTNHAGNTNTRSIGTCLVGDFRKGSGQKPTQAQMESLYLLNKELYKELPNMSRTIGHQECPGYSWKNCPGDGWNYKLVINGDLVSSDDAILKSPAQSPAKLPTQYEVQEGDTFWSIANEVEGLSVDELIALNPGVDYKNLKVGMRINLAKLPSGATYSVKAGDSLWGIARAYKGIEAEDIQKANNLKSTVLSIGQKLIIPVGKAVSKPVPPKPAPKPAPKPLKEYAHFPKGHGPWSVYPVNKAPIKKNAIGAINPDKFGGLEYEVLGHPYDEVVTIQTSSFGKVNIYVGDPHSKLYKK